MFLSKQHPEEESFKDKILNSLNNSDSSNTTGALKDAEKEKIMAKIMISKINQNQWDLEEANLLALQKSLRQKGKENRK